MIFLNSLPVTDLGQQWIDDSVPPDTWYMDYPTAGPGVERQLMPLPDDLRQRFDLLTLWMIYESYWCQIVRAVQVASDEYQFVVDYLSGLAREENFLVPSQYTNVDFPMEIDWCVYGPYYGQYPQFVHDNFHKSGWKYNPSHPVDDPRHPQYNQYQAWRDSMKPKVKSVIERVACTPEETGITFEE